MASNTKPAWGNVFSSPKTITSSFSYDLVDDNGNKIGSYQYIGKRSKTGYIVVKTHDKLLKNGEKVIGRYCFVDANNIQSEPKYDAIIELNKGYLVYEYGDASWTRLNENLKEIGQCGNFVEETNDGMIKFRVNNSNCYIDMDGHWFNQKEYSLLCKFKKDPEEFVKVEPGKITSMLFLQKSIATVKQSIKEMCDNIKQGTLTDVSANDIKLLIDKVCAKKAKIANKLAKQKNSTDKSDNSAE